MQPHEQIDDELPALAAEMQRTLADVGAYFRVGAPGPQAISKHWLDYAQSIRSSVDKHDDLVSRFKLAADHAAARETLWDDARVEERAAKVRLLEAVISTAMPCLYALSEPMIVERWMADGSQDRRTLADVRGLILIDGWDRDIRDASAAGKSLALLEDGVLAVLDHHVVPNETYDGGYTVVTTIRKLSIRVALEEFSKNRNAFTAIVKKLVKSVIDLANNDKRVEQIQESLDLADKFNAISVLLDG